MIFSASFRRILKHRAKIRSRVWAEFAQTMNAEFIEETAEIVPDLLKESQDQNCIFYETENYLLKIQHCFDLGVCNIVKVRAKIEDLNTGDSFLIAATPKFWFGNTYKPATFQKIGEIGMEQVKLGDWWSDLFFVFECTTNVLSKAKSLKKTLKKLSLGDDLTILRTKDRFGISLIVYADATNNAKHLGRLLELVNELFTELSSITKKKST